MMPDLTAAVARLRQMLPLCDTRQWQEDVRLVLDALERLAAERDEARADRAQAIRDAAADAAHDAPLAMRERCAAACEGVAIECPGDGWERGGNEATEKCAAAIRALGT